jgi:phosphonoacetate hydrolase
VPAADRTYPLTATSGTCAGAAGDVLAQRAAAVRVLLAEDLAHVVELLAWREPGDAGEVVVASRFGQAAIAADGSHRLLAGVDPLARQDPLAFLGSAERADPRPGPTRAHYPHAGLRLLSAFADAARAPDLVVVHTDAHHWPERGGHLGEHGSLGLHQSRAPMLLCGAGVSRRGVLSDSCRTVDVAPTMAHAAARPMTGVDGRARADLVEAVGQRVVGLLWDGAHCADLLELTAAGELPAVARLLERGCALAGGAVAEFPSVTLVNHTSALTGLGPGRHGIVHNVFWDRARGAQVVSNDSSTWHTACDLLRPGVQTLWEHLGDLDTACVSEPIDRGATYSTFALIRAARTADGAKDLGASLPPAQEDPLVSSEHLGDDGYRWSSQVDATGLQQVLALWSRPLPPQVMWWNTTLTDSAHHAGGPWSAISRASLRDSDRRLGRWLDLVEERGLLDTTTVLLTADHGMAQADPQCTGDWDAALLAAGVHFRDEAYGFLYFGV